MAVIKYYLSRFFPWDGEKELKNAPGDGACAVVIEQKLLLKALKSAGNPGDYGATFWLREES